MPGPKILLASPVVPADSDPSDPEPDSVDPLDSIASSFYDFIISNTDNSDSQYTAALAPLTRVEDISQCKDLRIETEPSSQWTGPPPLLLTFVDCNLNASAIDATIANIQEEGKACGVFYSSTGASCKVAGDQGWVKKDVPNLFTVTSGSASMQILTMIAAAGNDLRGTINSKSGSNTSSGIHNGLLALYIALGLFSFAVLVVFVGALFRVWRHPERYNHNGTNEERARGMARAMLDTIPLVRVRYNQETRSENRAEQDVETQAESSVKEWKNSLEEYGNAIVPSSGSLPKAATQGANSEISITREGIGTPREREREMPAIVSAPAPARVNTYAFSGGVRTPQRTPVITPLYTPNSDGCKNEDVPPQYSIDGFPFPIMHDALPNTPLETIDEHRIATGRSTPIVVGSSNDQNMDRRALDSPMERQQRVPSDPSASTHRITRTLKLPSQPPMRRRAKTSSSSKKPELGVAGSAVGDATKGDDSANIGIYVRQDEDMCPICFEEFEEGELLRALPCHHHFHATCLDPWLLKSSSKCPLCRADLRQHILEGTKNNEEGANHANILGHTFYFVKQRIRRMSESIRADSRAESRTEVVRGEQRSELTVPLETSAHGRGREQASRRAAAPSLRRSNTVPVRGILRLIPRSPSHAHLPRFYGRVEPDGESRSTEQSPSSIQPWDVADNERRQESAPGEVGAQEGEPVEGEPVEGNVDRERPGVPQQGKAEN